MTRRLLLTALGLSVTATLASAQEPRPAVRIVAVSAIEDDAARGQMPEAKPMFGTAAPPLAKPYAGGPPAAAPVSMGPPQPVNAAPPLPADGGLFMPQPDAPIYGAPAVPVASGGNTSKLSFGAEYLYWWTEGAYLPALLTTGPAASNGILGQPGTTILYGNGDNEALGHNGIRLNGTWWFGNNSCWGLDFSGFWLQESNQSYTASSDAAGNPLIARPFFNVNQNRQFSQIVAFPAAAAGTANVNLENSLWGYDVNLRKRLTCAPCYRVDALLGFRYINFEETLTISENVNRLQGTQVAIGNPNAASAVVLDSFSTENDFYGGQLGLTGELRRGRWFTNGFVKLGLGEMQSSVTIAGAQNITLINGTTTTANGGLLALPGANIGTYSQSKFTVLPEFGINLGYHLTSHLRVYVGYNFLYLNNVLRPGDQIDTGLDVTRIPNFPLTGVTPLNNVRPTVPLRETGMIVQGINVGLQFTW